jgi:hypothetical protein
MTDSGGSGTKAAIRNNSIKSMKLSFSLSKAMHLALLGMCVITNPAAGQSVTFDFQDGTDQGFGNPFGNDASKSFTIANIGGSLRMAVTLGGFQVAGREGTSDPFLGAMNAAAANPSGYTISYDWYVDTSGGNYGNFLQLGTYFNSGSGAYSQDFPGTAKDVELDGVQLASGGVFSGTVSETLTQKYGSPLNAGHVAQTFQRLGFIMNGDGAATTTVYFDNISITPVPEPSALALCALGVASGMAFLRRRKA